MFDFLRKKRALNDVKTSMSFLLGFQNDEYIEAIFKLYPQVKKAILTQLNEGKSSDIVAANTLMITFSDMIQKSLSAEQKEQLVIFLQDMSSEPPYKFADAIAIFLGFLGSRVDLGKFPEDQYEIVVSEIIGSAKGSDFESRRRDRIMTSIDRALLSSASQ